MSLCFTFHIDNVKHCRCQCMLLSDMNNIVAVVIQMAGTVNLRI